MDHSSLQPIAAGRAVRRRQRAYSLHDALVTLAVAGVLLGIGAPSFAQLIAGQRLTTAVNGLVTALYSARSEAIKRGERAVLCPSVDDATCSAASDRATDWHHGYLLFADANANHERDDGEAVLRVFTPESGLTIRSSRDRDHVTYQPDGLASGTNISLVVCAERREVAPRVVIVSNSGRARVSTRLPDGKLPTCAG